MTARKKASQQGARRVVASLDALASVFEHHAESLGVSEKVARDFMRRCDLLSTHLDRSFGLKRAGYYNPAQIGEPESGPLIMDSNNPFMNGHFTQEKFTELAEKQMSGALAQNAASHTADPVRLAKLIAKEAGKLAFSQLQDWAKKEAPKSKRAEDEDDKKSEDEDEKKEAKKSEDEDKEKAEDAKTAAQAFGLFASK